MINHLSPVNFSGTKNKKEHTPQEKKVKNKGSMVALAGQVGTAHLILSSKKSLINNFTKKNAVISLEENMAIKEAIPEILEQSGLKNTGVKIKYIKENADTKFGPKRLKDILEQYNNGNKDLKKILQSFPVVHPENKRAFLEYLHVNTSNLDPIGKIKLKRNIDLYSNVIEAALNLKKGTVSKSPEMRKLITRFMYGASFAKFERGTNACAIGYTNKIYLPENKLLGTVFHEMGHLKTQSFAAGKILTKAKTLSYIAPLIAFTAVFGRNRKETPENKLNPWHKTVNFVRDNAGKLMIATGLPLLADEALASVNAAKIMKKALSPEICKKINKANFAAFLTYLPTVIASATGVFVAVKIKNAIQTKHEEKVRAFNENLKNNTPEPQQKASQTPVQTEVQNALFEKFKSFIN